MGPAGSSGTGTGSTANVYTPMGQPAADQQFQDILGSFPTSPSATPAGKYYDYSGKWLASMIDSPYAAQGTDTAQAAYNYEANTAFPQSTAESTALDQTGAWALPSAKTALYYGTDPQYQKNVDAAVSNPYYAPALTGAQQAADIGTKGATALATGANQTLDTAYDPQKKLYDRGQSNTLDYANVTNAMSGLGGTPYGSSVSANALTNYDLNWQDKQLGRQEKALGAADTALTDASKLAYTSSGYPSKVYTGNLADINTSLTARDKALNTGAVTSGDIMSSVGTADKTAAGLDSAALKDYSYYGQLPYAEKATQTKDTLSGINDVVTLGNNQYTLPQQTIQDLESYLKLGQSASTISGDLGKTGLSELGTAASGLGSASSALFGTGGSGSSGLVSSGGLGGLFSGGSAASDAGLAAGGGGDLGVAATTGAGALDSAGVAALDAGTAAAWIICTELVRQGRMPRKHWAPGTRKFAAYPEIGKRGYYVWAIPSVRHLRRHPDSLYSRLLGVVFRWRAENIAAHAGVKGARKLWRGALVTGVLAPLCGVCGLLAKPQDWASVYREERS
jgi:hypothetical protein